MQGSGIASTRVKERSVREAKRKCERVPALAQGAREGVGDWSAREGEREQERERERASTENR